MKTKTITALAIGVTLATTINAEYLFKQKIANYIEFSEEPQGTTFTILDPSEYTVGMLTEQDVIDLNAYFERSGDMAYWQTVTNLNYDAWTTNSLELPDGFYKLSQLDSFRMYCMPSMVTTPVNIKAPVQFMNLKSLQLLNCGSMSIDSSINQLTTLNTVLIKNDTITNVPSFSGSASNMTTFGLTYAPESLTTEHANIVANNLDFTVNPGEGVNFPLEQKICDNFYNGQYTGLSFTNEETGTNYTNIGSGDYYTATNGANLNWLVQELCDGVAMSLN